MNRINPYTRLKKICKDYAMKVDYPRKISMYYWSKNKLNKQTGYVLDDVYQRVLAADALGYEVHIFADGDGMAFKYVEKRPQRPWDLV